MKKETTLLEFCISSLLIFGHFSRELAIILPYEYIQKSFLLGERLKGQLHRNIDYWIPFSVSEEEFHQVLNALMNEETWKVTEIPKPKKIVYDHELNSEFTTYENWFKCICKRHLAITEFGQFILSFTYKIFYKDRWVGNFFCTEARRNSKFKGTFIANDLYPFSQHKSVKHTVGERLEPLDLYDFQVEDTYSIRRKFTFMYLIEKHMKDQINRTMYFQSIYP